VGLNPPWYYDLEAYPIEITGNISLRVLAVIARTLGTTTLQLLEGADTLRPEHPRSASELADLLRARIAADGQTADDYGDRIGWAVAPVLAIPDLLWESPFEMLQALCEDLGVDPRAFVEGMRDEIEAPRLIERRRQWFERHTARFATASVVPSSTRGQRHACPCCLFITLGERGRFEICEVCFWEDDGQDERDADVVRSGPNGGLSLTKARANFVAFGAWEERARDKVRSPRPEEISSTDENSRMRR